MPQAVENLDAIREFIAVDSPRYADLVVERLVTAVDILDQFPQAGRNVPEHSRGDLRALVPPPLSPRSPPPGRRGRFSDGVPAARPAPHPAVIAAQPWR